MCENFRRKDRMVTGGHKNCGGVTKMRQIFQYNRVTGGKGKAYVQQMLVKRVATPPRNAGWSHPRNIKMIVLT